MPGRAFFLGCLPILEPTSIPLGQLFDHWPNRRKRAVAQEVYDKDTSQYARPPASLRLVHMRIQMPVLSAKGPA